MKTWKSAWQLAKHELQASAFQLLICWIFFILFGLLFLTSINLYLTDNYFSFDFMFICIFSFGPYLLKARHFQYKKVFDQIWASPVLVMQLQLPIPLHILVRSRLLIYLGYFIPSYCFTFIIMYMVNSELNSLLSIGHFFVFSLIWLAISLLIGIVLPASDVGDFISTKVMVKSIVIILLGIFLLFALFYGTFQIGIVAWTILFVQSAPLLAIFLSILILISIFLFWPYYMKKTIRKLDYM